jgi:hypothetical protein
MTGASFAPNGTYYIELMRPDGSVFFSQGFGSGSASTGPQMLDATGVWRVEVNPYGTDTGTVTLKLT